MEYQVLCDANKEFNQHSSLKGWIVFGVPNCFSITRQYNKPGNLEPPNGVVKITLMNICRMQIEHCIFKCQLADKSYLQLILRKSFGNRERFPQTHLWLLHPIPQIKKITAYIGLCFDQVV